jgi:hypothetical protein
MPEHQHQQRKGLATEAGKLERDSVEYLNNPQFLKCKKLLKSQQYYSSATGIA